MSKKNRPSPSVRDEVNVPTTERIAQPPAEPNAPFVETKMDLQPQSNDQPEALIEETPAEPTGPTAKEMAAQEEENVARAYRIIQAQQEKLSRQIEDESRPTMIEAAAGGIDSLHEAMRRASEVKPIEYIPPPRTERQMTALEQELEAGRKAVERNKAQQAISQAARARAAAEERAKEGFTTPVHRPADAVPNPLGGVGTFGADAT